MILTGRWFQTGTSSLFARAPQPSQSMIAGVVDGRGITCGAEQPGAGSDQAETTDQETATG